jgi:rubrerythrin
MFNDLERLGQLIEATKSESDVIRLAVSFEKDSILFFMSFRKLVGEDKGTVIDDLIKEEEEHLIKLSQIKKELQKGEM